MTYEILFNTCIEKQLSSVDRRERTRILEKIDLLGQDPRPRWSVKLRGRESYRVAVGDYRVLYAIDDKKKVVVIQAV